MSTHTRNRRKESRNKRDHRHAPDNEDEDEDDDAQNASYRKENHLGQRQRGRQRQPEQQPKHEEPQRGINHGHRLGKSLRLVERGGILSPMTLQASAVLAVAMMTALIWNWLDDNHWQAAVIDGNMATAQVQGMIRAICQHQLKRQGDYKGVRCHPHVIPVRRTQQAARTIRPGEVILELPRHLQLWDLDALRDPFVRSELLHARLLRNRDGEHPLPTAAFLAAHVARIQVEFDDNRVRNSSNNNNSSIAATSTTNITSIDPLLYQYVTEIFPTYEDYEAYHPILWSDADLDTYLGAKSSTRAHVVSMRELVQAEYDAFVRASPAAFVSTVRREDYLRARLNVMTRSFGTGPLPFSTHDTADAAKAAAAFPGSSTLDMAELELYRSVGGIVELEERGSHVIVPILDLKNHHARPNVGFSYRPTQQTFVVSAISTIATGYELFDSYGKRTDSDLFARYGFVNGDGSGWTQASLANWHNPNDQFYLHHQGLGKRSSNHAPPFGQKRQEKRFVILEDELKSKLSQYLKYDWGYHHCIEPKEDEDDSTDKDDDAAAAWHFKVLKYQYLAAIAKQERRWVVRMTPRDARAEPGMSSHVPSTLEPPPVVSLLVRRGGNSLPQMEALLVFDTCRLISMTHYDYNGNATAMVQRAISILQSDDHEEDDDDNNNNIDYHDDRDEDDAIRSASAPSSPHMFPTTNDGLEYRTQWFVARSASTALSRFGRTVDQQRDLVARLNRDAYGTRQWTAAHLQLGEMQTLNLLVELAFGSLNHLFPSREDEEDEESDRSFRLRDDMCPPRWQYPLLFTVP